MNNVTLLPSRRDRTALANREELVRRARCESAAFGQDLDFNALAWDVTKHCPIQEEVSFALSQVDPNVRRLRTRMTLREAFLEDLNKDQKKCADKLEAFLADPSARVFLLKGDAGAGKTFMAKGLVEYMSAQGRGYRLCRCPLIPGHFLTG